MCWKKLKNFQYRLHKMSSQQLYKCKRNNFIVQLKYIGRWQNNNK